MGELAQWLGGQLDEEADAARRAFSGQMDPENGWLALRPEWQQHTTIAPHVGMIHEAVQADHVVRWNPARVLREVEAKRQALAHYERIRQHTRQGDEAYVLAEGAVSKQIQIMATAYADRPGYREEWRP